MLPSPIHLREVEFLDVSVKPRIKPNVFEPEEKHERFNFDKTRVRTSITHAEADEDPESPFQDLLITFELSILDEGNNPPPYIVSMSCVGYFTVSKKALPDAEKRLDLAVVNGASMIYGVMREMLITVTSRSWYGALHLPTASFYDARPSIGGYEPVQTDAPVAKSKNVKDKPKSKAKSKVV